MGLLAASLCNACIAVPAVCFWTKSAWESKCNFAERSHAPLVACHAHQAATAGQACRAQAGEIQLWDPTVTASTWLSEHLLTFAV